MKYGISIALVLASLSAACAPRVAPAPVTNWGAGAGVSQATDIRVARGDTLFGIARRYHQPVRLIIEANRLVPPYRLEVGRILRLPGPEAPMLAAAPPPPRYAAQSYSPPPPTRYAAQSYSPPPMAQPRVASVTPVAPVDYAAPAQPAPAQTAQAASPRIASSEVPPANRPPLQVAEPLHARSGPPSAIHPATAMLMPAPTPEPGDGGGKGFVWPVRGRILENYGSSGNGTHNDGINIAARAGSPVHAAKAGEIVYVGNELRGYGNLVLIKHEGGYLTAYAHNSVLLVHRGEHVARGQVIARVGTTGQVSQPQLHFEIRAGRTPVNPAQFLPAVQQASAD